jgi:3-deoxy-D-manno-octulosonate 8-phosphate phosphatase (KDO 8-P phosphatase)
VTDHDRERLRAIELLVLDVDGVLTDGVIAIDDHGVETKHFHVRDGAALTAWRRLGRRAAILSGRSARAVEHRAADLGIAPVLQGVERKAAAFRALVEELGFEPGQACYMGDDLADLGPLRLAGLAACPADAAAEVRAACHLVTTAPGGRGAAREVIEAILGAQGLWEALVAQAGDNE